VAAQCRRIEDPIVLALPRGGVPVAREVARALGAPWDVWIVRKVGVPSDPEVAMGAVASGGVEVRNPAVLGDSPEDDARFERAAAQEREELARRERVYRGDRPRLSIRGRTVILVDDGVATGSTMLAAIRALQGGGARSVIVAVPVCPPEVAQTLSEEADQVVVLLTPASFWAISPWYEDFPQLTDEEVTALLT
jgi:putative phosphoribosyl transferase